MAGNLDAGPYTQRVMLIPNLPANRICVSAPARRLRVSAPTRLIFVASAVAFAASGCSTAAPEPTRSGPPSNLLSSSEATSGLPPASGGASATPSPNPSTGGGSTALPPQSTGIVIDVPTPIVTDAPSPASSATGELVDGKVCNSKEIAFTKEIPTVLILVDKSTSMFASNLPNGGSGPFGTSPDRWEAMRAAVAALEPFGTDVAFSLATYTSFKDGDQCPALERIDVVPMTTGDAPNQFADILASIPPSAEAIPPSKSETPTGAAITAAQAALQAIPGTSPKYILVITDGDPDTCLNFDPQCGQDVAIGAAQDAFDAGIQTFVVGISDDVDDVFLNDLAHAGQGQPVAPPASEDLFCIQSEPKPGTTFDYNDWRPAAFGDYGADGLKYEEELFFKPTDVESFTEQVKKVVNGVRSCEFEMDTAVVRAQAGKGGVRLGLSTGTASTLVYDDPNGWSLAADNDFTVVFNGTACEQLKLDSEPTVKIEFPCEVRVPRVL
jgi:von Willebrand factor type A domain